MSKLFGVLGKRLAQDKSKTTPKRFTRFAGAAEGVPCSPDTDKKFTRFAPQEPPTDPTPATQVDQPDPSAAQDASARKPRSDVPTVAQQPVNMADHLNSDAQIPVSILRRALPQRFAEMQEQAQAATFS